MADLTALESKIGEVLGLAMAAQDATAKVGKLVEEEGGHNDLRSTLQRMAKEAKETEERTTDLASDARRQEDRDPREGPRDQAGGRRK